MQKAGIRVRAGVHYVFKKIKDAFTDSFFCSGKSVMKDFSQKERARVQKDSLSLHMLYGAMARAYKLILA